MLAPPNSIYDLKQIILKQQAHYSDFAQKVIELLTIEGKNKEADAIKKLSEWYGLFLEKPLVAKQELEVNQYGHLDINALSSTIVSILKRTHPSAMYGKELRHKIGPSRIYEPIYKQAMRDLQFHKKIIKSGTAGSVSYLYNEKEYDQKIA